MEALLVVAVLRVVAAMAQEPVAAAVMVEARVGE